ncbi:MAG: hypothetical protein IPM32_11355 [Ignavibacteriae bacterium]|nr:hypothetical protein [Ignavibacteriota bacterium]
MKNKLFILFWISFSVYTSAQIFRPSPNEGFIGGAAGLTWIDGEPFYSVHLFPELSFAKFGIGLDLNLDFDKNGKLRNENFNETSDYLSLIRYVRYGQKSDPFYLRLGALDFATIGHGSIMYLYNNSPSFDSRKVGLEFNIDFNFYGVEAVYSTFAESGIIGLRTYTRPLLATEIGDVPIIGAFEIGATYTTDFNKNAGVIEVNYNPENDEYKSTKNLGATEIIGFDFSLPLLRTSIVNSDIYYDYAEILDFGNGRSAGIILDFYGLGLVDVRTKLERRWNGVNYLPSYFNSFYELERFQINETSHSVNSKIQTLHNGIKVGNGYYGELLISVINSFFVFGSYQRYDKNPDSGALNLRTEISPENGIFVARAGYDKLNIKNEKDLFTLDNRSFLFAEVGYKLNPYILVSMVYNWTFTPIRDLDDNFIRYKPQRKIEPRISFIYPFNFQQ